MLTGLSTPTEGDIEVLGLRIPQQGDELRRRMGYMTQKFSLFTDLTVRENLEFLAAVYDLPKRRTAERLDTLFAQYGLEDRRDRLVEHLSGGEKQRLALAAAVVHEPELLFLDEPTSGVDPESRREFWEKLFDLADGGTTILVSTHYMDEAERCHRLAILDRGTLVADGAPHELVRGLEGRTIQVRAPEPRRARQVLLGVAGVLSAAQIGNDVRVLVTAQPESEDRVRHALLRAGVAGEVKAAPPTLEDVFVAATHPRAEAAA
jgi:ABC-2 type transport system ATP-binding protein